MKLSEPAFTIHIIAIQVARPIEQDITLFWAYTNLGISQKSHRFSFEPHVKV